MNDEQKLNSPLLDFPARNTDRFSESDGVQAKLAAIGGGQDDLQKRTQIAHALTQHGEPPAAQNFGGHLLSLATVADKMHAAAGNGADAHQQAAQSLRNIEQNGIKIRDETSEPKGEVTHNPAVHS